MTAPDCALERLNYFNGQRLEAADLRAEQAYHIGVRRALNRALFSPGIGAGLEVVRHPGDQHRVLVMPGLAIDAQGREIIVSAPLEVLVQGSPAGAGGLVLGNYLVISYAEAKTGSRADGCRIEGGAAAGAAKGCGCGGSGGGGKCGCGGGQGGAALEWGGMSRIRATPMLECQNAWPAGASGRIVLAQLRLNAQCQVIEILGGMRQYTSGKQAPRVRALSLEGEKDIDHANPKVLFFQVEGANPRAVTLHLWTTRFSSLYYTELGRHQHQVSGATDQFKHDFGHHHDIANGHTDGAGGHSHNYFCGDATQRDLRVLEVDKPPDGSPVVYDVAQHAGDQAAGFTGESAIIAVADHTHTLALADALGVISHGHAVSGLAHDAGATATAARDAQPPLGFIGGLQVLLDGADITPLILARLEALAPGGWAALGDGGAGHALASAQGTGGVDLKQLGIELALGAHQLVFSVPPGGGGQLHYNLYVE